MAKERVRDFFESVWIRIYGKQMRYEEFAKRRWNGTEQEADRSRARALLRQQKFIWTWWPSLNQRAIRRVAAYWFCEDMIIETSMWGDISRDSDSDSGPKKSTLTNWLLFRSRIRLRLRPRPISPYTTISRSERSLSMSKGPSLGLKGALSRSKWVLPRPERAISRSERTLLVQESSF